ncbi:MAG: hypothetical protein WCP19_16425 [Chloroflexota bacterium]
MTTPSPIEQISNDISALQTRIGWMQDNIRLKSTVDAIEDLQTMVNGMKQFVSQLRSRGYVFEKELENQAADLPLQWSKLYPPIQYQVNNQTTILQQDIRLIEQKFSQLNASKNNIPAAKSLLSLIETDMDSLEDKIRSAENTITSMFNSFKNNAQETKKHLDEIDFMLTQLAEAKFSLLSTEGGIMAVKAVWCKDVKERSDDPEGILFLTDQRILFEQKEEVATKKVLFITTEKKMVQELKWENPVILLGEVVPSKMGLLKNEDHLDIRFNEGAALETAHLHILQDCNAWLPLLNRAKAKDFDKSKAVMIDQAEIDKVKALPSQCPSCGGNLTQVVLRGQDSINCEYCGFLIRL